MAQKLIFSDVTFSIEEELETILIKGFNAKSRIKGHHAYTKERELKMVKISKLVWNLKMLLINLQ